MCSRMSMLLSKSKAKSKHFKGGTNAKTSEKATKKCYDFYCSLHTLFKVQCVILTCMCVALIRQVSVDVCMLFALHMACF